MPMDAPGPVIEVTRPTVMSAALAGRTIAEAIAAAPARRTILFTRTSRIGGENPITMRARRQSPLCNFLSLKQFRRNGFLALQTGAAELRRWDAYDTRHRSDPRHRRHRHRIDLCSRRARSRSHLLGYARRVR